MASASKIYLRKSALEVKLHEPSMVQPSEATPHPHHYFLSNMDQAMAPLTVTTVFVFSARTGCPENPAMVMKEALQKVLVHYYPVAGRLRACASQGRLLIQCNGEGVLFVEADANIALSDLGDLALPNPSTHGRLIFPFPAIENPPLLTAQVTKFQCGGFVLGLVFNHGLLDGVAVAEFLNAWAETVQGLPLSIPPILDRAFLKARSPLHIKYPHTEYLDLGAAGSQSLDYDNMVYKSFCFSPLALKELKKKALEDGKILKCSTVEVLCALMWKARSKAMEMPPEQPVKLIIGISAGKKASTRWKPVIPKGYMGNGFMLTYAVTTAAELEKEPLSDAVKRVQEAMALGIEQYMRSQIDYMEREKVGMPPLHAAFVITSWCGLRFYEMELGWGKPKHAGPATLVTKEAAVLHPHGENQKNVNVVLSLPPHAARKMDDLLHPHLHVLTSRL